MTIRSQIWTEAAEESVSKSRRVENTFHAHIWVKGVDGICINDQSVISNMDRQIVYMDRTDRIIERREWFTYVHL